MIWRALVFFGGSNVVILLILGGVFGQKYYDVDDSDAPFGDVAF